MSVDNRSMIKIGFLASICSGLFVLTACGYVRESVEQPEVDRAILNGELSAGDWIERNNDNEELLMFGLNQTEPKLSFRCNLTTKQIFVEKNEYIANQNQVNVKLITSTGSKSYEATVENHGLPAIHLTFPPEDVFLDKIATASIFAVVPEVGTQLLIPGSPKIDQLFARCT